MGRNFKYVYGPVFSRRLGHSLGVDLVPFKTCSYDCIYCQLGRTTVKTVERSEYVSTNEVMEEVGSKLAGIQRPDFVTLAGSGEPTLHSGIGQIIQDIKQQSTVPVAVLTNGSLLWMPDVKEELMMADVVLPSLDAGDGRVFPRVNRPHRDIEFDRMAAGLIEFTREFQGEVWLEIFLLAGINDSPGDIEKIAGFVQRMRPKRVQLNTVARPTAEKEALPVPLPELERLKGYLGESAEVVVERKEDEVSSVPRHEGDGDEILTLLRRRPCTLEGVAAGLGMAAPEVMKRLDVLCKSGLIAPVRREGRVFYEVTRDE